MRSPSLITAAVIAAGVATVALTGCVAYPAYQPAYQPVPIARLTPEQSAALASRPVDPAQRERDAAANAQFQREDQAAQDAQVYSYAYPAYPLYPAYSYGFYGYPYYGGFYPFVPGLSLSFGFRGGYGYHGGYRGGFRGHR
jgi:hypothetical protein